MRIWNVTWVGSFGTVMNSTEDVDTAEEAVAMARQQLIDHHGIDPEAHGMALEQAEVVHDDAWEHKGSRCEDYPCCGHEAGDCNGGLYGSDESIKARIYAMSAEQFDAHLDMPDSY